MIEGLLTGRWYLHAVFYGLSIIGLWKIFVKCEKKGWWSLIPAFREYQLAKCVDRETDGRMLLFVEVFYLILNVIATFTDVYDNPEKVGLATFILLIAIIFLGIAQFVYIVRIYSGLCDLFGYSRKFILFVIFIVNF